MSAQEKDPLVSICIPTYNGEKYLVEALESVKSQTYKNIEVIISDDNSKDSTLHICQKFKEETNFPVYIFNHHPSGIGTNWNYSIEKANGEYIKLLFQDDVLENNCVEIMMEKLLAHNLEVIFSKRTIIDENSTPITNGHWYRKYHDLQKMAGINSNSFYILSKKELKSLNFDIYSRENILGEPCVSLFTKKLFKRIGPFDQQLKQALDYEYWLRVLAKFEIGIISEKLVKFRFHNEQTTNKNVTNQISEGVALNNILFGKLLFYIDRKHAIHYIKNKYPIIMKIMSLKYKLFP